MKDTQAHSLSRVSSVCDEGVDEELVSISSCDVQWCISVLIFTVNLSTFRKNTNKQTKHLACVTATSGFRFYRPVLEIKSARLNF